MTKGQWTILLTKLGIEKMEDWKLGALKEHAICLHMLPRLEVLFNRIFGINSVRSPTPQQGVSGVLLYPICVGKNMFSSPSAGLGLANQPRALFIEMN
jgi:hypothetical protein